MRRFRQQLCAYKFYSQDLLHHLLRHPYPRIGFLQQALKVSRPTAAGYLNKLAADALLTKHRRLTANYYVNQPLFELLARPG